MKLFNKLIFLIPLSLLFIIAALLTSCSGKDIEGGVTYDGNIAIDCDESVTEVTLRDGTVGIASGTFSNCKNLAKITIPESVKSIMPSAFSGCDALFSNQADIKYADKWVIYADADIENAVIADGTVGIAYEAFAACKKIKTFSAPNSVKYIGKDVLYGASEIVEITLPFVGLTQSSNKYLGYIFGALSPSYNSEFVPESLKKVTLTNEKNVSADCFSECKSIKEIVLFDVTETVGDKAFSGCTALSTVTLPDSITKIGSYAFAECHGMITVNIPKSLTVIPLFAFKGCISLTEITIPESVKIIEACALANCANLTSITLPTTLESIGQQTFDGCNKLSHIEIPSGIVGKGAFNECSSLTTVILGDGVTKLLDNAFFSCISLRNITLSNSLTSIGEEAFCYCPIATLDLPESLTEIGDNAFNNCKELSDVEIPDSVTRIGSNAFFNCLNLIKTSGYVDYVDGWIVGALPAVTYVVVSEDVRGVADSAFIKCSNFEAIYLTDNNGKEPVIYNIGDLNSKFKSANVYHFSDEPTDNLSGWHYVDGIPTVW